MSFAQLPTLEIVRIVLASAVMLAGVADDLRSRKFHNWLFLTCVGLGLVAVIAIDGISGLHLSLLGFLLGFVVLLPFVLLKMIGAGDMKLLAAFGLIAGTAAVLPVILYGFVWGAIFGVFRVVGNGQGRSLVNNLFSIVMLRQRQGLELHRMPFTVGLMMGWVTYLTLRSFAS